MTDSRKRAIRLTIITAAVSLLLSAACCAAFILNVAGLHKTPETATVADDGAVSVAVCMNMEDDCEGYTAFQLAN